MGCGRAIAVVPYQSQMTEVTHGKALNSEGRMTKLLFRSPGTTSRTGLGERVAPPDPRVSVVRYNVKNLKDEFVGD